MISLKHLSGSKIFKRNSLKFWETFMFQNKLSNGFHQFKNLALYKKMHLNLVYESHKIFRQYSEKVSQTSEKNLFETNSIIENSQEEEEVEEEYSKYEEMEEEDNQMENEELFKDIANGDPDTLKKLKLLEFEIAILKGEGCRVPDKMKRDHWLELLSQPSLNSRKLFLSFIRTKELMTVSEVEKARLMSEYKIKRKQDEGFYYYGLGGQTMLLRIYSRALNRLLCLRQMTAEQTIIFDCSYQNYMSQKNTKHCAKQIFLSLNCAKNHPYPCNIKFCNFNENDLLGKIFPKYVCLENETFSAEICKESYLDLYPKEKLVYLSPHARNELVNFKKDKIYIIGAYVDQGEGIKASLAKAKENNIQMAKFPLDYYLSWKLGSKNLPLNTVMNILLDMNYYNDWDKALKHIPSRCLYNVKSKRLWSISSKSDMDSEYLYI